MEKTKDRFVWSKYLDGLNKATPQALIARLVELVNTVEDAEYRFSTQQRTIRRLRRQVRHLKRLIKSKDRLIYAQEEFYKCMLDECHKREEADKKKSTEFFTKCLLNALYATQNTV